MPFDDGLIPIEIDVCSVASWFIALITVSINVVLNGDKREMPLAVTVIPALFIYLVRDNVRAGKW